MLACLREFWFKTGPIEGRTKFVIFFEADSSIIRLEGFLDMIRV